MPEKLMRCFVKVKKSLAVDNPKWSSKRVDRVARAICVKQTGQKFSKHSSSVDNMFNVSFSESGRIKDLSFTFSSPYEVVEASRVKEYRPAYEIKDPESAIVVGRALFDTVSKNFNKYLEKEVKKSVSKLPGVTCQVDHSESARDTFGVVHDSWWDTKTTPAEMAYIAELEGSDPVTAKVVKGYLRGVSVRGEAKKIECSICGEEWNFMHEHWPGETYDGKVCERIPRDFGYRHLGFTPVPAVDGADAHYVAASMAEAIDNAMAYIDYQFKEFQETIDKNKKTQTDIFGEFKMSESDSDAAKALREAERAKYELAETQKKYDELSDKLKQQDDILKENERLKTQHRERLIKEIVEKELALKKIEEKNVKERTEELEATDPVVLEAKLDVLRDWYKEIPEPTRTPDAGSKSKVFTTNSTFQELDEAKQEKYIKEAKAAQLAGGLFGRDPSITAVKTLEEWDAKRGRWKTNLAELFRSVPKR